MKIAILVLSAVCIYGCSPSATVALRGGRGSLSYVEFNREFGDRGVVLLLTDGSRAPGDHVHLAFDSVHWSDAHTGQPRAAGIGRLKAVDVNERIVSGLAGLALGILAGGAAGGVIGDAAAPKGEDHALKTGLYAAGGGIVGGLAGFAIGTSTGWTRTYLIVPDSTQLGAE